MNGNLNKEKEKRNEKKDTTKEKKSQKKKSKKDDEKEKGVDNSPEDVELILVTTKEWISKMTVSYNDGRPT